MFVRKLHFTIPINSLSRIVPHIETHTTRSSIYISIIWTILQMVNEYQYGNHDLWTTSWNDYTVVQHTGNASCYSHARRACDVWCTMCVLRIPLRRKYVFIMKPTTLCSFVIISCWWLSYCILWVVCTQHIPKDHRARSQCLTTTTTTTISQVETWMHFHTYFEIVNSTQQWWCEEDASMWEWTREHSSAIFLFQLKKNNTVQEIHICLSNSQVELVLLSTNTRPTDYGYRLVCLQI